MGLKIGTEAVGGLKIDTETVGGMKIGTDIIWNSAPSVAYAPPPPDSRSVMIPAGSSMESTGSSSMIYLGPSFKASSPSIFTASGLEYYGLLANNNPWSVRRQNIKLHCSIATTRSQTEKSQIILYTFTAVPPLSNPVQTSSSSNPVPTSSSAGSIARYLSILSDGSIPSTASEVDQGRSGFTDKTFTFTNIPLVTDNQYFGFAVYNHNTHGHPFDKDTMTIKNAWFEYEVNSADQNIVEIDIGPTVDGFTSMARSRFAYIQSSFSRYSTIFQTATTPRFVARSRVNQTNTNNIVTFTAFFGNLQRPFVSPNDKIRLVEFDETPLSSRTVNPSNHPPNSEGTNILGEHALGNTTGVYKSFVFNNINFKSDKYYGFLITNDSADFFSHDDYLRVSYSYFTIT